jgi:hypothetical protein
MSIAELFYRRQAHRDRTTPHGVRRHRPRRQRAFLFEPLEPRVLLSATIVEAIDDTALTNQDAPVLVDVLANDTGESLTITGFTDGANGTVQMVGGQLLYTPDSCFSGTDTFTYTISGTGTPDETVPGAIITPGVIKRAGQPDKQIPLPELNFAFDKAPKFADGHYADDHYADAGLVFLPDTVGVFNDGDPAWSTLSEFDTGDGDGSTLRIDMGIRGGSTNPGTMIVPPATAPAGIPQADAQVLSGYFVMPNTPTDAVTEFLTVEVGIASAGNVELAVYDLEGNFFTAVNDASDGGPHERSLITITSLQAGFDIHRFEIYLTHDGQQAYDFWALTQIEFGDLAVPVVTDTATVTVTVEPGTPAIHLEKYLKEVCDPGGLEGGKASFWKANTSEWFGYSADMRFEAVFGVNVTGDPTLLQALNMTGTGQKNLMREATAALLNASHLNVNYKYTESEVVAKVRQAIACNSYSSATDDFTCENARTRNLADGAEETLYQFGRDADSGPGLQVDDNDSLLFTYVVTNPGDLELSNITVRDDNGTPGNTADDFTPHAILDAGFNVGDTDRDGKLDVDEAWLFVKKDRADRGHHVNIGEATGQACDGTVVRDTDAANYTAGNPYCFGWGGNGHDRDDDDDDRNWRWDDERDGGHDSGGSSPNDDDDCDDDNTRVRIDWGSWFRSSRWSRGC